MGVPTVVCSWTRVHARRARGLRLPGHPLAEFSARDALRTHAASSVYSKARGGRKAGAWESDNEKRAAATPAIKSAAVAIYSRRLSGRVRRRCRGRAATTAVHFRDFAP